MTEKTKIITKRGKPSYFMSILGVTLVLFLLGIIGWLIINTNALGDHFKSNIEVRAFLREPLNPADSTALVDYVKAKPYVREFQFTTKEMAKANYMKDGNEDWKDILTENPLPQSIDFKLKAVYVNPDSLHAIKADLEKQTYVSDVDYPEALVKNLEKNIRKVSLVLLGIAILMAIVVIILIDNTIRLAMFSNRFTIKTMQMVGATRWFIAKPMDMRAILNGAVSGLIAIAGVVALMTAAYNTLPELKALQSTAMLTFLFVGMLVLGILITLVSTHTSVIKYLRKKLDDLY